MTSWEAGDVAVALRRAFDESFAKEHVPAPSRAVSAIGVTVGGALYAVAVTDVAGVFRGKLVTRVPSDVSAFLGVAGFRGVVVPVYDLGALLGHGASSDPPWVMLASAPGGDGAAPVGFAFESFDGYVGAATDEERERSDQLPSRTVVTLPSLLQAIERALAAVGRAPGAPPREEERG